MKRGSPPTDKCGAWIAQPLVLPERASVKTKLTSIDLGGLSKQQPVCLGGYEPFSAPDIVHLPRRARPSREVRSNTKNVTTKSTRSGIHQLCVSQSSP